MMTHIVLLLMIWSFIIGGIVGYEVFGLILIFIVITCNHYTHYRTMYKWLTVEIFYVVRSDRYKLPIPWFLPLLMLKVVVK